MGESRLSDGNPRKNRALENMYKEYLKRGLDICLPGMGLVVLTLPMDAIALTVKLDSEGHVF